MRCASGSHFDLCHIPQFEHGFLVSQNTFKLPRILTFSTGTGTTPTIMDSLPFEFADDVKTLIAKEVLQMDFWEHRAGKTSQMFAKKLRNLTVLPISDTRCLYRLEDWKGDFEPAQLCQPMWDAYGVSLIFVHTRHARKAKELEMDSKEFRILRNIISKSLRPIECYVHIDAVSPVILSLLNAVPRFFNIFVKCSSSISETICNSVRAQALSELYLKSYNMTDDLFSCLQTFIENCNFESLELDRNPRDIVRDDELVNLLQEKALDIARKGKFVELQVDSSVSMFWEGVEYYSYEEELFKGSLMLRVSPTPVEFPLFLSEKTEKRQY
ncbi:hypothetical protein L596_012980 [Steinernema carpocapsae]|uniref:Uncharacterized protein n=1 Tax=Steinernema carpocapsae TaxID=34508 RepID=A0A4U5NZ13_STECR|nr:hypothetical protein L596_012980 [Steinernema carpocapsae]